MLNTLLKKLWLHASTDIAGMIPTFSVIDWTITRFSVLEVLDNVDCGELTRLNHICYIKQYFTNEELNNLCNQR